jgi:hypothetical protein
MIVFSFSVTLKSWRLRFYGTRTTKDPPTTTTSSYSNFEWFDSTSRSESRGLSRGGIVAIVLVIVGFLAVAFRACRCRGSASNSRTEQRCP